MEHCCLDSQVRKNAPIQVDRKTLHAADSGSAPLCTIRFQPYTIICTLLWSSNERDTTQVSNHMCVMMGPQSQAMRTLVPFNSQGAPG